MLERAGRPVAAGGNLGTASLALPLLPDDGVYVIEMSSYMLERLHSFHADTACLLNLTPDHLDRHGDMAGYAAAKRHVFDNMTRDDLAVIGIDDDYCQEIAQDYTAQGLTVMTLSVNDAHSVAAIAVPMREAPTCLACIICKMRSQRLPWRIIWALMMTLLPKDCAAIRACRIVRPWLG